MSFEILLPALIACATLGLAMACAHAAADGRRAQEARAPHHPVLRHPSSGQGTFPGPKGRAR